MRAEFSAFKARVASGPVLTGRVYDTVRLNTDGTPVRDNYVVLTPSIPVLNDARYMVVETAVSAAVQTINAQVVATSRDGLLLLLEALQEVIGWTPDVPGRDCTPVSEVAGVEEGFEKFDRTARLYYIHTSYRFWSRPNGDES